MQRKKNILLITPDQQIFLSLNEYCNPLAFNLVLEEQVYGGLERLREMVIDLIIWDADDPVYSQERFFQELKAIKPYLPVICMGSSGEESFIIKILNDGSDDYWKKPISYAVLSSKINAIFRHSQKDILIAEHLTFGFYTLDMTTFTLRTPNEKKILTPSEANILKKLILNRGEVCSREDLMSVVKRYGEDIISRNIDVHITAIRKKIGQSNYWIKTVRGIGYMFRSSD